MEVVDVGVEEGPRVEGRQADGGEALGGLEEGVAGQHKVAQQEEVALVQGVRPRLGHRAHQVPDQQHPVQRPGRLQDKETM